MSLKQSKKPVILIGMMGSGKSTVGKILAARLNSEFFDSDKLIEQKIGKTIPEIFAAEGEKNFREYETAILKNLLSPTNNQNYQTPVIATGGGIVLAPENRELMKKHAITLWLNASHGEILKRVSEDKTIRPLLAESDKSQKILDLLAAREKYYQQANFEIDTDQNTPEEVVKKIIFFIGDK